MISTAMERVSRKDLIEIVSESLPGNKFTKKTEEFWSWKHDLNPFGRSEGLVAYDTSGGIIAVRPLMQWRVSCRGNTIKCWRPVDTVVRPQARGQGLFSSLTKSCIDMMSDKGVEIFFNNPNSNSVSGYKKLGWKKLSQVDYSVAVNPRFIFSLFNSPSSVAKLTEPELREMVVLYKEQHFESYVTDINEEYIRWRFINHPSIDYFYFKCTLGYVVYRLEKRWFLSIPVIVSVFTSSCNEKTLSEFLANSRYLFYIYDSVKFKEKLLSYCVKKDIVYFFSKSLTHETVENFHLSISDLECL